MDIRFIKNKLKLFLFKLLTIFILKYILETQKTRKEWSKW